MDVCIISHKPCWFQISLFALQFYNQTWHFELSLHRMDNNTLQAGRRFSSSSRSVCVFCHDITSGRGGGEVVEGGHKTDSIWPGNWLRIWPGEVAWEGEGLAVAGGRGLPREKAQAWRLLAGVLSLLSIQLLTKNMGGVTRESSCRERL